MTDGTMSCVLLFATFSRLSLPSLLPHPTPSAAMDASSYPRGTRGRGNITHDAARGRPHSRNKHWSAADSATRSNTPNHSDSERWERGGHRGGGRGRGAPRGVAPVFHNVSLRLNHSPSHSPQPRRAPVVRQPVHPPEVHEDVEIEEVQDQGDEFDVVEDDMALGAETNSGAFAEIHEPELDSPEEREKFYQEVRASSVGNSQILSLFCSW